MRSSAVVSALMIAAGPLVLATPTEASFGAPTTISLAGQNSTDPRLAMNPLGDAVVVWTAFEPSGPGASNLRIQGAFRRAGGSFGPVETLSAPDTYHPASAIDSRGNAVGTWIGGAGTPIQVAFRPREASFGGPENISGSPAPNGFGDAYADFDAVGNLDVVWYGGDDGVQIATRPADGDFGPAQTISAGAGADSDPWVAHDAQGNTIVVWQHVDSGASTRRVQAAYRPAGGSFGPPETISDPTEGSPTPRIAFDAQGNAIAVWRGQDGSSNYRIQAAFRAVGGDFQPQQAISSAGQDVYAYPQLSVAPNGDAIAAWSRFDGSHYRVQAAFRPAGGPFTTPQTVSPAGQDAFIASRNGTSALSVSLQGDAVLVWQLNAQNNQGVVQTAFRPSGSTFGLPQTLSAVGGFQPEVTLDAKGNAIATWTLEGTYRRIQVAFACGTDSDGDGFCDSIDCAPFDPHTYPGAPQLCDGVNNNCTDATWPMVPASETDADGDGYRICDGDCNDADTSIHPGAVEVCNGLDDDCDEQIDEGYVPQSTSCGVGACSSTGSTSCVNGTVVDGCTPGQPSTEICDGVDNDCDGQVDEGYLPQNTSCGVGACASTGLTSCVNGQVMDGCTPRQPSAEVCNGIDDNCNGQIDEDALGLDTDGDGVHNACDNCRTAYNPDQLDADHDGLGNACDNCILVANPTQQDTDGDMRGEACDNCPASYNPFQDDTDADGLGDACDNCPSVRNVDQRDWDHDGEGDLCDLDDGLILITKVTRGRVEWQDETLYSGFNLYRGSLEYLFATGHYTQDSLLEPEAAQWCGLTTSFQPDPHRPPGGTANFYLVTGRNGSGESSLGQRSDGAERTNHHPCP